MAMVCLGKNIRSFVMKFHMVFLIIVLITIIGCSVQTNQNRIGLEKNTSEQLKVDISSAQLLYILFVADSIVANNFPNYLWFDRTVHVGEDIYRVGYWNCFEIYVGDSIEVERNYIVDSLPAMGELGIVFSKDKLEVIRITR